jgi:hypothetical protein
MAPVNFAAYVRNGPQPLRSQGDGDAITSKNSFEAAFARRSMMLVRRLLGNRGIEELLKDEIAASNDFWKTTVAKSDGKWKPARVKLSIRGIKSEEFLYWLKPREGRIAPENVASHPEHWTVYVDKGRGGLAVCETLGERPAWFLLRDDGTASEFVDDDPQMPAKFTGRGYLGGHDGVQMIETYHQFRDHDDDGGFDADLAVYFPAACEDELIECHRQHLLVEFTNWFRDCHKALRVDGS